MLGLLPENVRRLKQGKPIFKHLGEDVPELAEWQLFIGHNASARDNGKPMVNITFNGDAIDRFVLRKMWEIPAQPPDMPFCIVVFYTEDQDKFMATLLEHGVTIHNFVDRRGTAN